MKSFFPLSFPPKSRERHFLGKETKQDNYTKIKNKDKKKEIGVWKILPGKIVRLGRVLLERERKSEREKEREWKGKERKGKRNPNFGGCKKREECEFPRIFFFLILLLFYFFQSGL